MKLHNAHTQKRNLPFLRKFRNAHATFIVVRYSRILFFGTYVQERFPYEFKILIHSKLQIQGNYVLAYSNITAIEKKLWIIYRA